jgi:hypothetical protein
MKAAKASRVTPASSKERMLFSLEMIVADNVLRMKTYFFSASAR